MEIVEILSLWNITFMFKLNFNFKELQNFLSHVQKIRTTEQLRFSNKNGCLPKVLL